MRAIRKRYFERSDAGILDHDAYASRAAWTASATSSSPACATSARGSSSRGEIVVKYSPDLGSSQSPPTKSPYRSSRRTISVDSGAGAYQSRDYFTND